MSFWSALVELAEVYIIGSVFIAALIMILIFIVIMTAKEKFNSSRVERLNSWYKNNKNSTFKKFRKDTNGNIIEYERLLNPNPNTRRYTRL